MVSLLKTRQRVGFTSTLLFLKCSLYPSLLYWTQPLMRKWTRRHFPLSKKANSSFPTVFTSIKCEPFKQRNGDVSAAFFPPYIMSCELITPSEQQNKAKPNGDHLHESIPSYWCHLLLHQPLLHTLSFQCASWPLNHLFFFFLHLIETVKLIKRKKSWYNYRQTVHLLILLANI